MGQQTNGRTNRPTDGPTDMGDYIVPSWVNPGSKMITLQSDAMWLLLNVKPSYMICCLFLKCHVEDL